MINRSAEAEVILLRDVPLRSGLASPIYINLATVLSCGYNMILELARFLWHVIEDTGNIEVDLICGQTYGALFVAHTLRQFYDKPFIYKRKEAKTYGVGKLVIGKYKAGDRVLVAENVVVGSGLSVIETVETLRSEGLICVKT